MDIKSLQNEWYKKLEDSGFSDIEKNDKKGIAPEIITMPACYEQLQMCQSILNEKRTELSSKDVRVLELYIEGYNQSEIATELTVTQQAVSKRILKLIERYY